LITTYQTLRDYQFSLCRIDWSFVIFDEAQHIKNPNTLATRAAKGLKAQFKLLATGTPVENHLGDFWCLMDTASPGTLGAYQSFRKTYIAPIRQAGASEVSQVRLDVGRQLRKETGALMLRRLKEDNIEGLPSKIFHLGIKVDDDYYAYHAALDKTMEGEQLQRYNTIIDVVLESKEQEDSRGQTLSGLHRLREISLHPFLLNQGTLNAPKNIEKARDTFKLSGKLHSLLSILDEKKILLKDAVVTPEEVSGEDMSRFNFINFEGVNSGSDESLDGNSLKLLSWQEFEAFCAELYQQYYEGTASLTPPKDHGADVVVLGRENVLIQCKSTSQKRYNSLDSLKDVYFSKPGYEEKMNKNFQTLIAVTNANGYSKRILKEAEVYGVQMVSRKTLEKLLKKFPVTRRQIQRRLLEPKLFE